jgi:ABC-type transport system involved in Fe-S cluster assembly fused permease/ATPase subunit
MQIVTSVPNSLAQLYGPLASLGWTYRSINQSLVDTEKLLNLLNEPTEVNDKPDAPDLVVDHGEIEFSAYIFFNGIVRALMVYMSSFIRERQLFV